MLFRSQPDVEEIRQLRVGNLFVIRQLRADQHVLRERRCPRVLLRNADSAPAGQMTDGLGDAFDDEVKVPRRAEERVPLRECPRHRDDLTPEGIAVAAPLLAPGAAGGVRVREFVNGQRQVDPDRLPVGEGTGAARRERTAAFGHPGRQRVGGGFVLNLRQQVAERGQQGEFCFKTTL